MTSSYRRFDGKKGKGNDDDDNDEMASRSEIESFFESGSGSSSIGVAAANGAAARNAQRAEEERAEEERRQFLRHPMFNDLDVFFTRVYEYYLNGGARNYTLSRLSFVVRYALTLVLMFILLQCVDYERLASLVSSPGSIALSEFCYFGAGGAPSVFTALLFTGFSLYLIVLLLQTARDVHIMFTIGKFYNSVLGLHYTEVQTCEWELICRLLIEKMPRFLFLEGGTEQRAAMTEVDVANRIMRKQNYMIAMHDLNVLAWDVEEAEALEAHRAGDGSAFSTASLWNRLWGESWNPLFATQTDLPPRSRQGEAEAEQRTVEAKMRTRCKTVAQPLHYPHPLMTHTLELALHYGLFLFAFDARQRPGTLRRELEPNARYATLMQLAGGLRWRFRLMAVIGFLLCPFVLVYVAFGFFLEHGEQVRNRPQDTFATRRWSNEGNWTMREYNELPHLLRRRLNAAHEHATLYLGHFSSTVTAIVARLVSYCCGAFIAVLLLLFAIDDALPRIVFAAGRSGLWWLTVFGVVLAAARGLIPPENAVHDPKGHLRRCARFTHYFPDSWRGIEHTGAVRDRFARLFEHRWSFYVRELLSILYTPFLLLTLLPERSEALLLFFRDYSVRSENCGTVVRFAAFDDKVADAAEKKDDKQILSASASAACFAPPETLESPLPLPEEAGQRKVRNANVMTKKMETSMLGFSMHHPHWKEKQQQREERQRHEQEKGGEGEEEKKREESKYKWMEKNDFNDVLEKLQAIFDRDNESNSRARQLYHSDEMV